MREVFALLKRCGYLYKNSVPDHHHFEHFVTHEKKTVAGVYAIGDREGEVLHGIERAILDRIAELVAKASLFRNRYASHESFMWRRRNVIA